MTESQYKAIISLLFIIFMLTRGFCVEERTATHAAVNVGFSEPQVTDAKVLFVGLRGCDAHDAVGFTMSATNATGQPSHIIICCGWPFKGCTVRTP